MALSFSIELIYKALKKGKFYDILIIDENMPFVKGSQITIFLKTMVKENSFPEIFIASYTAYDSKNNYFIDDKIFYKESIFLSKERLTKFNGNRAMTESQNLFEQITSKKNFKVYIFGVLRLLLHFLNNKLWN